MKNQIKIMMMFVCLYSSMALGYQMSVYKMNNMVKWIQESGIYIPHPINLKSDYDMHRAIDNLKQDILKNEKSKSLKQDFLVCPDQMHSVLIAVITNKLILKEDSSSYNDPEMFSESQDSVTPDSLKPGYLTPEYFTDKFPSILPFATSPCQRALQAYKDCCSSGKTVSFKKSGEKSNYQEDRFLTHCQLEKQRKQNL